VLLGPHAAHALRTMHALGVLEMLIPSFTASMPWLSATVITAIRWTSITFLTIDNVHGLPSPPRLRTATGPIAARNRSSRSLPARSAAARHCKARRTGEHAGQSVELADAFLARLDFDAEERESILNLIRLHLEMSAAMRRDIFDLENVRGFSEKIGKPADPQDAHRDDLRRHQGRQP